MEIPDIPIPNLPVPRGEPPERGDPRGFELLLWLARSPPLVQAVLADRDVPPGSNEVALSLARDADGPALLVDRSGRALRAIRVEEVDHYPRVRRTTVERLVPTSPPPPPVDPSDDPEHVLGLVERRGVAFFREDAARVRRWGALLAHDLVRRLVWTDERQTYLRVTRVLDWFRSRVGDHLEEQERAWTLAHQAGTYAALSVSDWTPPLLIAAPALDVALVYPSFSNGVVGPVYRACWAIARAGELFLNQLDRRLAENDSEAGLWAAVLGAGAVAALDEACFDDALERMDDIVADAEGETEGRVRELAEGVEAGLLKWARSPEALREEARMLAAPWLIGTLPDGHPAKPGGPGDIPEDLAVAALASMPVALFLAEMPEVTRSFARLVPAIVNAPVEHLFWPRDLGRAVMEPFGPRDTATLLAGWGLANVETRPGTGVSGTRPDPLQVLEPDDPPTRDGDA